MVLFGNQKYACLSCIRGHRSSSCDHRQRILLQVRRPGRRSQAELKSRYVLVWRESLPDSKTPSQYKLVRVPDEGGAKIDPVDLKDKLDADDNGEEVVVTEKYVFVHVGDNLFRRELKPSYLDTDQRDKGVGSNVSVPTPTSTSPGDSEECCHKAVNGTREASPKRESHSASSSRVPMAHSVEDFRSLHPHIPAQPTLSSPSPSPSHPRTHSNIPYEPVKLVRASSAPLPHHELPAINPQHHHRQYPDSQNFQHHQQSPQHHQQRKQTNQYIHQNSIFIEPKQEIDNINVELDDLFLSNPAPLVIGPMQFQGDTENCRTNILNELGITEQEASEIWPQSEQQERSDFSYAAQCVLPGQCQCGEGCQCPDCYEHRRGHHNTFNRPV